VYDNTATINETQQTASAQAVQCNTNTGALSKGFWQGPNGQNIIKNYCAPNGGTSLLTFLTSLNPYNESALTTSTTCLKQATYVANVINAGTCTSSTATCNSMLKAQMLATALDVYFSTSVQNGGSGNRIGAYNGLGNSTPEIGGILIDLTKVCPVGSTCTSNFEDARPEFGIVNTKIGTSILRMLQYANFCSANGTSAGTNLQANGGNAGPACVTLGTSPVSNLGGSAWYAQNKNPKQVYAKDAFDDIDNQVAAIAPGNVTNPSF